MTFRSILVLLSIGALLSSCTDRYQELLRDRDSQIRTLNGQVASANGRADTAEREAAQVKGEYDKMVADYKKNAGGSNGGDGELGKMMPGTTTSIRNNRLSINVPDEVAFDSGSATLKGSAGKVLDGVAKVLKSKFSTYRLYVSGHTDSDPISKTKDKYKDNLDLSLARAEAVARYLMEHGVPASHIAVVGYGQYDSLHGKKDQDRRVEIVVAAEKVN